MIFGVTLHNVVLPVFQKRIILDIFHMEEGMFGLMGFCTINEDMGKIDTDVKPTIGQKC